jgi:hypothetical protein
LCDDDEARRLLLLLGAKGCAGDAMDDEDNDADDEDGAKICWPHMDDSLKNRPSLDVRLLSLATSFFDSFIAPVKKKKQSKKKVKPK